MASKMASGDGMDMQVIKECAIMSWWWLWPPEIALAAALGRRHGSMLILWGVAAVPQADTAAPPKSQYIHYQCV